MKKRGDYMLLAGRVLLVLGFLAGGFLKFRYLAGTAAYLKEIGVPGAGEPLALITGLIEFVAALFIMVGYKARLSALVLFIYLMPVTWFTHLSLAHSAGDLVTKDNEIFQTLKNAAAMGGLILLYLAGPGVYSLDRR